MKQVVHVNQHNIKANAKGANKPVLTVKTYKDNQLGNEAILRDKEGNYLGKFVYSPDKPLSCGAKVWFEVDTETVDIEVLDGEVKNETNIQR